MTPTERFRDRQLSKTLRRRFPPPPYLTEREVRPWLLDQMRRYADESPLRSRIMQGSIRLAERLHWADPTLPL